MCWNKSAVITCSKSHDFFYPIRVRFFSIPNYTKICFYSEPDPINKISDITLHCAGFKHSDWLKFFNQPIRMLKKSTALRLRFSLEDRVPVFHYQLKIKILWYVTSKIVYWVGSREVVKQANECTKKKEIRS